MKINSIFKDNLTFLLVRTSSELRDEFANYLAELNLVPPHKGIMTFLRKNGEANQLTLCEALAINKATMVRFIDHLQELKYIQRNESKVDRREKVIKLTKKGHTILEKIEQKNWDIEAQYTSSLTKEEVKQLKVLLLKLHEVED